MLEQANNFGYATLTDLGNFLGGKEKIILDDLDKTVTGTQGLLAKQCRLGS
jgi:hypothetical protein